ncbi:OLC1v1018065C1 [Oldenlandia corymbosa var. corymbosa]|uniref:OLC1v1018065C1 n=1 Tax=Oldenlandia corymbosa var. corymbosa TaxID=529605 RepID=A0AAV1EAV0_OLDCO|nr:OLC1v1018065C1 [Oldenlandia corymbosa var. corymbosa]
MPTSSELPDCFYSKTPPDLITPCNPTPKHTIYLSNLDDQTFLRFSIKYLYLFKKSTNVDLLKQSLSRVLVDYYPLAGRLRKSRESDHKLEVECNGEGAVFAEAFMDITADEFDEISDKPNRSFRKLLYKVEAPTFLDIPPLVVQVTNLRCGGMILCTAINHGLCDGIGTAQFLQAWAHLTTKSTTELPIIPFHHRHVLKPRCPPQVTFSHPTFAKSTPDNKPSFQSDPNLFHYLQSQPLVPSSLIFKASSILSLKRKCVPSLKCTNFDIVSAHTWRCWVRSFDLSPSVEVKLLFSMNIRRKLELEIPEGYYGNAFVLGCVEATVKELTEDNLHGVVKLVQHAKSKVTGDYVKSMIDHLEDKTLKVDLSRSLVISPWSKLGLEDLDFGEGKALQMGPLTSDIYCLFLPIMTDVDAVRVLVSMPESVVSKFEKYMTEFEDNGMVRNGEPNGNCNGDLSLHSQ